MKKGDGQDGGEAETVSASSTAAGSETTELSFTAAMTELESILARIEEDEIDLDRLATEMSRASELLELCRTKLRRAEAEVEQVVLRLGEE